MLGTMVTDETYEAAKRKMAAGYNAIPDRIEIINYLLASGEISGDIDIEPITITANGEYLPGAGKAFGRVVVEGPEDKTPELLARECTTFEHSTVKKIAGYAFYSYTSLTSVSFPACTVIGNAAFSVCSSLTSAYFPACTSIGSGAFYSCSSLTSVSFPVCTSIGSSAFQYCSSLTSVSFPACTYISPNAFYSCSALRTISLGCSEVCRLTRSEVFSGTSITKFTGSIFVPASLVSNYQADAYWSYFSNRIFPLEG